jgi:hypothetical protein
MMRQHEPFDSIYLDKFEVVEQVKGRTRLYPHTEQLPAISRALNLEFYGALPGRIARVDARADNFRKILLHEAAWAFCNGVNAARTDKLRLLPMYTPDLVAKIGVVQHITAHSPPGPAHSFRFFSGHDFFPDIHLSGHRIAFADHVLERFSSRVPHHVGEDIATFLTVFFTNEIVAVPVGQSRAFIVPYCESFLAFTFKRRDGEYFITTCLTAKQINTMTTEMPAYAVNLHYGPAFTKPRQRIWVPEGEADDALALWKRQAPFKFESSPPFPPWKVAAGRVEDVTRRQGHGERSALVFLDGLYSPVVRIRNPDAPDFCYDLAAILRTTGCEQFLARDPSPDGPDGIDPPVPPPHIEERTSPG